MADVGEKRPADADQDDSDDGELVGPPMPDAGVKDDSEDEFVGPPMPAEEPKRKKKRKVLAHENLFLENLPSADQYETSYTHREPISQVVVTKTDFVITASRDGILMFWKKKNEGGIEFVKTFKSHLGDVVGMASDLDGAFLATTSEDKTLKIYNILAFDMINMMKLPFKPGMCEWIHKRAAAISRVAVVDTESAAIYIYDGRGNNVPIHCVKTHIAPVTSIKYNPVLQVAISSDEKGMIEYWDCAEGLNEYEFPQDKVKFEYPSDTDLYDFVKQKPKAIPWGLCVSPDGKKFASMASDRKVRLFSFTTGKLLRVYDESEAAQETGSQFDIMELKRSIAGERELSKSPMVRQEKVSFDESSNFLLYPSMVGIKVVNTVSNKCVKILGKGENMRFLSVSLYQGFAKDELNEASTTLDMEVADNPGLKIDLSDPTVFATAYKKQRFFLFSRREPEEQGGDIGRDVFNLKPTREEQLAATGGVKQRKLAETVTIHTTLGDITIDLFVRECPKSIENFVTHCRDGYYTGVIFHRVIKGFMIQTGDPEGDGTGGESIWGKEFEDEFHKDLRHDRPYTVSMANAGPNTNGSQFFITLVPTPWLDNKHTVFGRVSRGMETCQEIGNTRTDKDTDKPYEDIKIINVSVR